MSHLFANKTKAKIEQIIASRPPYYLGHFLHILDVVVERYDYLLWPQEEEKIGALLSKSLSAQCLYIRLCSRKGSWFREDKLSYGEIQLDKATSELERENFIKRRHPPRRDIAKLHYLWTKQELCEILDHQKTSSKKEEIWGLFLKSYNRYRQKLPPTIELMEWNLYARILVIFFGNPYQDLSTFVVEELRHLQHYPVPLSRENLWKNRRQLSAYIKQLDWERDFHDLKDAGREMASHRMVLKILPPLYPFTEMKQYGKFRFSKTADYRLQRFLLGYAKTYSRLYPFKYGTYLRKISTLYWPDDLKFRHFSLQLIHAKKTGLRKKVKQLLAQMNEELMPLSHREQTLYDINTAWLEKTRRIQMPIIEEFLTLSFSGYDGQRPCYHIDGKEYYAEEAVLDIYRKDGWLGLHSENFIPRFSGVMLFLVEIFSAVRGQFQSQFQNGPLDFNSRSFYKNRKKIILEKFVKYKQGEIDIKETLINNYLRLKNYALPDLYLKNLDDKEMIFLIKSVPSQWWLSIAFRYIQSPAHHGNGFPDLVLLHHKTGDILFTEVKSPGDKLSDAQRYWIKYLMENKVKVTVTKILTAGPEDK